MAVNQNDQDHSEQTIASVENEFYRDIPDEDYDTFYEEHYANFEDDAIRAQLLSQNNIVNRVKRYSSERYSGAKAFYQNSVEEHREYFSDKENVWRQKQQAKRDREFIKKLLVVILLLSLLMGGMLLLSRL